MTDGPERHVVISTDGHCGADLLGYKPYLDSRYHEEFEGWAAGFRWLVDFCADAPGRRAGMAQVFLENLDDTIAEIRWAKEHGLSGVLLPAPHVRKMINLYYPRYDAVWAVCEELEMPLCIHGTFPVEGQDESGIGGQLAGFVEAPYYPRRQVGHLLLAGVFDRFPGLKLAATEFSNASSLGEWLAGLDAQIGGMLMFPEQFPFSAEAARQLQRKPSEYFESNVYLAGPLDLFESITAGRPNLMFGADLPHAEGTAPFTTEVLRLSVAQLSGEQEVRRFLSERAAQLYGFDLNLLQGVADRVGPRAEDLRVPLPPADQPRWPDDTRCMALASGAMAAQSQIT